MAQFQQKPEDQQKPWAGLPAEPFDESGRVDVLPANVLADPFSLPGSTVSSTSVPLVVELPDEGASPEAD